MNTEIKNAINKLAKDIHENAKAHGWHDKARTFGDCIALIHAEASEALEDFRDGRLPDEVFYEGDKPCGIPSELADIVIRVFDMCMFYGIDIGEVILEKHEYNKSRPYRHGGRCCKWLKCGIQIRGSIKAAPCRTRQVHIYQSM